MKALQQYLELFHAQRQLIDEGSCSTLNSQRQTAYQALEQHGLPTQKTEEYKYTNVENALAPNFGLNLRRLPLSKSAYERCHCHIPDLNTDCFYVVNDTVTTTPKLLPAQLADGSISEGVIWVGRIADFEHYRINENTTGADFLSTHYNRLASEKYDALTAFNTMFAQDALIIYVPEGAKALQPIQVVNIATAKVDFMSNRRTLIYVGKLASVTLLTCEETPSDFATLSIHTTEVFADEGAHIDMYDLEQTSLTNTRFNQCYIEEQAKAQVSLSNITLHNGITRNTTVVRLKGEQANIQTSGAIIANSEERVDNHILVDHAVAHCNSDMLYKYVLDDSSIGAFAGKVLVRKDAQKTNSQQTNANLCSGPKARAFGQPMLEIYADDVKCNHGSTVGKLDTGALFYMQQRGIPEKEARLLLQYAFINDVLRRITLAPLRERLSHLVELRFRGELRNCEGCRIQKKCHE